MYSDRCALDVQSFVPLTRKPPSTGAARVRTEGGRPVHILTDRRSVSGGAIVASAGPWRTSGGWWHELPTTNHQLPTTNY